ncbi:hypothetical protein BpHYR1_044872 [Brachionus plicatilis]|uniref:Uncharacterized protein n=1 Tax=Brachionus plicatilis TaxID=10195 RepID=A0A3M7R2S0_BRAPC|nr:hypothetical protein BpHYR1_044872 [Brachionus plicatilis]
MQINEKRKRKSIKLFTIISLKKKLNLYICFLDELIHHRTRAAISGNCWKLKIAKIISIFDIALEIKFSSSRRQDIFKNFVTFDAHYFFELQIQIRSTL